MGFSDLLFTIFLILIIGFVSYNLYIDVKDYVYTKNIRIMDILLSNKIII